MASHRWEIPLDGTVHFVEYTGNTPAGEARIVVDGEVGAYNLVLTIESRYRAMFRVDGRECMLEMDAVGETVALTVDGTLHAESVLPATAAAAAQPEAPTDPVIVKALRRQKSGMSNFLMLIGLSTVNIVLILAKSTIFFPFSISASAFAIYVGQGFSEQAGGAAGTVVGIVAAVLIVAAFGVLYLLARKHTWPVWTGFGLMVFDTVVLAFLAAMSGEFASSLIDLAFHLWILYTLLNLGLARRTLAKAAQAAEAATAPAGPPAV